jgi:hypothetical protein
MKVAAAPDVHLTYCTNIHAGESWSDLRAILLDRVVAVKRLVAPDRAFGVGLRVSARAADELAQPSAREDLQRILADNDLYVFTINGFPYGNFHATRVKETVYRPDWLESLARATANAGAPARGAASRRRRRQREHGADRVRPAHERRAR